MKLHVARSLLVLGLAAGAACGLLNGLLVVYAAIEPFLVTLGTMSMARGAALLFAQGSLLQAAWPAMAAWLALVHHAAVAGHVGAAEQDGVALVVLQPGLGDHRRFLDPAL